MKKFSEQLKRHRAIIIICIFLAVLIVAGVLLLDSKTKSVSSGYVDVTRTDIENKLIRILSEIDGVGQSEVMITEGDDGIEGVVIVCEGAENIMVRNNVLNVVTTCLKVEKSNIAIYAMNK